ncbi:MAG: RNA ligase family protein [Deltaproteobacteria bacterium]|nr:RNA ligase family protein [Deltaproteobacteria bacterium]
MEFEAFQKIPRLMRDCTITEKIDGTNAQIAFDDAGTMWVGSRNRWLTVDSDNFGFCAWAKAHEEELRELGPGRHYGEWFGAGIQRKYGLEEKRFALFNTARWGQQTPPPSCCSVVPVLYCGPFSTEVVDMCLSDLRTYGSRMVFGWKSPEGVVVYHHHSRTLAKVTLDGDGHKG